MDSGCIIFSNILSKKNQEKVLQIEDIVQYCNKFPAFVFSGEHRREALSRLNTVIILYKLLLLQC
jgi:hypothetical protein